MKMSDLIKSTLYPDHVAMKLRICEEITPAYVREITRSSSDKFLLEMVAAGGLIEQSPNIYRKSPELAKLLASNIDWPFSRMAMDSDLTR